MFPEHKGIRLKNENRKIRRKISKHLEIKYLWVKEKVSRRIRKYFVLNEKENTTHKICGMQIKQCQGGIIASNVYIKKKTVF